ncbi:CBS domain-containing protein [Alicyclobacillus fastidiosus]|uniref:CBS domain-containing protein n=1 Tax=Alicyclobacillus fastidiosus TaxID=392011 RepID=A0ABV5AH11_9BACL|nr:CBS domain-containing protein [Alicyclobacillus fastidiosus]WEH08068.1 CBS domain-containing protein [Alicyclobacillus fastidiosus]
MFIRNCLTPLGELTSIHPNETIASALKKMSKHLSLPCVGDADRFVGIVSKRSIFEAFEAVSENTSFLEFAQQSIAPCVIHDVPRLTFEDHFEDTIEIIIRIPFVPIVQDGKFLGIVKRSDVQSALAVAFATNMEADRLLLGVPEVEGAFERMFNTTHRLGLSVVTCVPFDAGENLNRRVLLKVRKSQKLDTLVKDLERAGFLVIQVN